MKEKTLVFIDNHYLDLVAANFGMYNRFDIAELVLQIVRNENLWCEEAYLYTAPPHHGEPMTLDEKRRMESYNHFVSALKRFQYLVLREGRCQKIGNAFKQKGVDTLITMDLTLVPSIHPDIKTVVVLTADTDFVPVLDFIRKQGVKIILYYFSDFRRHSRFSLSNHLFSVCDKRVLLTRLFFEKASRR